jgi:hypothetical protein
LLKIFWFCKKMVCCRFIFSFFATKTMLLSRLLTFFSRSLQFPFIFSQYPSNHLFPMHKNFTNPITFLKSGW